jgi:lysophospholipase L1-like esterase
MSRAPTWRVALIGAGRLLVRLWLLLGATLLVVLAIDLLLRSVLPEYAEPLWRPGTRAPARERPAVIDDPRFAQAYAREHAAARHTEWRSYVYWRRKPYRGRLIEVDAHGFRRTWHDDRPIRRRVWVFGGSVVWGTGVADEHTLPSLLARRIAAEPDLAGTRVANFGESGYVTMQGLIAFQRALACGDPGPDLVLFLDGANDVYSAFQSGVAGLPQNEANRVLEFNLSRRADQVLLAWAARLHGIRRLGALLAPAPAAEDAEVLGAAVVRQYLEVVQQTRQLARARSIAVLHAWQPTVYSRAPPRGAELDILGASPARLVRLQQSADGELRRSAAELGILDLGAVYDRVENELYTDFVHPNRQGLELLADAVLAPVLEALRAAPERAPSAPAGHCRERPVE